MAKIAKKDFYPLRLYVFGDIKVWGIARPDPYLESCYGKNWSCVGIKGVDHQHIDSKDASNKPFLLEKNLFGPAKSMGVLKYHKEKIENIIKNSNVLGG